MTCVCSWCVCAKCLLITYVSAYQYKASLGGVEWCALWVAVCCSVVQCVAVCMLAHSKSTLCGVVLQRVAACCSVLQRVAACCSVLQRVAVSDNVQISTQQIHRVLTLNVLVTDVILSDCMKLQHSQPQHRSTPQHTTTAKDLAVP